MVPLGRADGVQLVEAGFLQRAHGLGQDVHVSPTFGEVLCDLGQFDLLGHAQFGKGFGLQDSAGAVVPEQAGDDQRHQGHGQEEHQ